MLGTGLGVGGLVFMFVCMYVWWGRRGWYLDGVVDDLFAWGRERVRLCWMGRDVDRRGGVLTRGPSLDLIPLMQVL